MNRKQDAKMPKKYISKLVVLEIKIDFICLSSLLESFFPNWGISIYGMKIWNLVGNYR